MANARPFLRDQAVDNETLARNAMALEAAWLDARRAGDWDVQLRCGGTLGDAWRALGPLTETDGVLHAFE